MAGFGCDLSPFAGWAPTVSTKVEHIQVERCLPYLYCYRVSCRFLIFLILAITVVIAALDFDQFILRTVTIVTFASLEAVGSNKRTFPAMTALMVIDRRL